MIHNILNKKVFLKEDIINILSIEDENDYNELKNKAIITLKNNVGDKVFLRGLIEYSNHCSCDCFYCGLRKSNKDVNRYILDEKLILHQAKWCAENGYGSLVLQSGEIKTEAYLSKIEKIIKKIKENTVSDKLPNGLGITISLGEQTEETYQRLFYAGAHRYLLRIESSNQKLYKKIHPDYQKFENRIKSLKSLKKIGYQVGTGVMIGIPGQSIEDLAEDILFFKDMDVDMIGMGPFIASKNTPLSKFIDENQNEKRRIYQLTLKMIAATRIVLKDVNIASTTALQALYAFGREEGLNYGANVIMPLLTPMESRKDYYIYDGKPCIEDNVDDCFECIKTRIESSGRKIGLNKYGDSKHFFKRNYS